MEKCTHVNTVCTIDGEYCCGEKNACTDFKECASIEQRGEKYQIAMEVLSEYGTVEDVAYQDEKTFEVWLKEKIAAQEGNLTSKCNLTEPRKHSPCVVHCKGAFCRLNKVAYICGSIPCKIDFEDCNKF